ncbi:MAG: 6,7-dimethyl-8-ribityllumazine synthase [Crocinitomicaceae bacterium]|nr:6,7-dimethyl-8-ribityllumazine synthase [Crocinitomicaceae bacterium]
MATANRNLSAYQKEDYIDIKQYKIGIVVSDWNSEITSKLQKGAIDTLIDNGVDSSNIEVFNVPGTFELPLGAQFVFESIEVDGIIAIGTVIKGETKHFDYVCQGATEGIMQVGLKYNKPVSFCVLTDNNIQQSIDRAGGKHGNKGTECAISCLKMIALKKKTISK